MMPAWTSEAIRKIACRFLHSQERTRFWLAPWGWQLIRSCPKCFPEDFTWRDGKPIVKQW
jgi:hypothetical protein